MTKSEIINAIMLHFTRLNSKGTLKVNMKLLENMYVKIVAMLPNGRQDSKGTLNVCMKILEDMYVNIVAFLPTRSGT